MRAIAAERDVSMGAIIREAIDEKLSGHRRTPRSIGIGASGLTDTSRRAGEERAPPLSWRDP
jgi:hypothetical protein